MYPEYQAPRKILLMGESEAAKFLPRFTKSIDDYISTGGKASIHSLAIGNPFMSGVMQRINSYKTARALNLIDESNMDQIA